MFGLLDIFEITQHAFHSALFIVHLIILLIFCSTGRADIVVYDGAMDIAQFPDNELSYTQSIRRNGIEGVLVTADPLHACTNISRPPDLNASLNWFVLMSGNFCTFETKVRNARLAGYTLGIIYSYRARVEYFNNLGHRRFYSDMPAVVVRTEHGLKMKENYLFYYSIRFRIVVFPNNSFSIMTFILLFSIVAGLFLVIMLAFTVWMLTSRVYLNIWIFKEYCLLYCSSNISSSGLTFFQQPSSAPNGRLSSQHLRQLQTTTYQKGDLYETCAICLEDYKDKDKLRLLPCSHGYHMKCIDPWLTNNRRICPVCKRKVLMSGETSSSHTNPNFEEGTENTPLLQGSRVGTHSYSGTLPVTIAPRSNLSADQTIADHGHSTSDANLQPERQS